MDLETRALVRHLFAEITARLEAVAALAAEGQDARRRLKSDLALLADLEAVLTATGSLVGAIRALLAHHAAPTRTPARGRRRKRPAQ